MKTTILLAIAGLCPIAALTAQEIKPFDAKPGLWENTITIEVTGMPAMPANMPQLTPEQLAKIPEAQRKQVEAMMASRGGGGSPRATTSKSCVTREALAKALAFGENNQANCTRKVITASESRIHIQMECTPDKMNMTVAGDITIDRIDAEHVKGGGVMKTTGTGANSNAPRSIETKMSFNNKWVSSDCGDVKPSGENK